MRFQSTDHRRGRSFVRIATRLALAVVVAVITGCGGDDSFQGAARFGEPIVVAPADFERWVWITVPEMRCADDSPGGFAVNFTERSRDLVVYLLGGGVCYDLLTCTTDQALLHGLGDDPLVFLFGEGARGGEVGIFDRTDPANPMRDSNFVVLPHCTGDFHASNKISVYPPLAPVHQVGYANVTAAIQRIVPTFRDASRVVFAGFSAGGVGVSVNYHQFASAFESVGQPPPILINDAGPTLRPPYLTAHAQDAIRAAWGLDQTVDPWCPTCATEGLHTGARALAELHPGLRSSIICATSDVVVFGLYALLNGDTSSLEDGLLDLTGWVASYQDDVAPSRQRHFLYEGDRHGAMVVAPLSATPGLASFLDEQLRGDPAWSTVLP